MIFKVKFEKCVFGLDLLTKLVYKLCYGACF